MTTTRKLGWIIAGVAAAVFVVSVGVMSRRVSAFYKRVHYAEFRMDQILARHFTAHDRKVTIEDYTDEHGDFYLRLRYGDAVQLIPAKKPTVKDMPDLGMYDEWVRVLATGVVQRGPGGKPSVKPGSERLIIVSRRTPEGFDPDKWGAVRRADWVFDFYELKPDGSIDHWVRRWPTSSHGDLVAHRDPDSPIAKIQPLQERSFEYQAALFVIPKLAMPKQKFRDTAVNAMGWTLPVAGFSVLAALVGLGMAVSPDRRTATADQDAAGRS